jgi:NAD(P)H-hydrate epimerase
MRAGCGYVRLSSPGLDASPGAPTEAVYHPLEAVGWADRVAAGTARFASAVIGPGLGRSESGDVEIRRAVATVPVPLVVDGDALSAMGERAGDILRARPAPAVLTPHDGEYERLAGRPPGADRFEAARRLAAHCRCVVVLKGPTTVVADPEGTVGVSTAGDPRLATAGTGDVLAGIVGALLAQGVDPWRAALAGAELHGRAGQMGPVRGLVAGDLVTALPAVWEAIGTVSGVGVP